MTTPDINSFQRTGDPQADLARWEAMGGTKEQLQAKFGDPERPNSTFTAGQPMPMLPPGGNIWGASYPAMMSPMAGMPGFMPPMFPFLNLSSSSETSSSTSSSTVSSSSSSVLTSSSTSEASFDDLSKARKKELASWREDYENAHLKEYKAKYSDKKERALNLAKDSYDYIKQKWEQTYPGQAFPLKDNEPVAVYDEMDSGKAVKDYSKKELRAIKQEVLGWKSEFYKAHKAEYKAKYSDSSERSLQMTKAIGDYVLQKWNETHPDEACPTSILYSITHHSY